MDNLKNFKACSAYYLDETNKDLIQTIEIFAEGYFQWGVGERTSAIFYLACALSVASDRKMKIDLRSDLKPALDAGYKRLDEFKELLKIEVPNRLTVIEIHELKAEHWQRFGDVVYLHKEDIARNNSLNRDRIDDCAVKMQSIEAKLVDNGLDPSVVLGLPNQEAIFIREVGAFV